MSEILGIDFQEEQEVRRCEADWDAIERLPPKLRAAGKLFIETGDLWLASAFLVSTWRTSWSFCVV